MVVLGRHSVGYYECDGCGSLQTEEPHWLAEAYTSQGTGYDTGAAQRSVSMALTMHAVLDFVGLSKRRACLDFGAGTGLYARLMRDRGYNYWAADPYNSLHFMDRFVGDRPFWALVSAFEVAEHMSRPREEWSELFAKALDYIFFTTELYCGQGQDWPYLAPETGQHVFFYSERALAALGASCGWRFTMIGVLKTFHRASLPPLTSTDIQQRALELLAEHQRDPYRHAVVDYELLRTAQRKPL